MQAFESYDGARLAYRTVGRGEPLLVVPGGPMRDQEYMGELGGLADYRTLHFLSLRGTGGSEAAADHGAYRADHQARDVEAFRAYLGLESVDVLGHSAGAAIAILYAAANPSRVGRLALVTPNLRTLGIEVLPEHQREAAALRKGEPWYAEAALALEKVLDGTATDDDWDVAEPFYYGRWDDEVRAFVAAGRYNDEAMPHYFADGVLNPLATKAALAELDAPVLVLAGEYDMRPRPSVAARAAELFPKAAVAVQPRAGHFPWLDDPAWFTRTVAAFLA